MPLATDCGGRWNPCCLSVKLPASRPSRTSGCELKDYFGSADFQHCREMDAEATAYRLGFWRRRVPVYKHTGLDVCVWRFPLDLTISRDSVNALEPQDEAVVLFHYTSEAIFSRIVGSMFHVPGALDLLRTGNNLGRYLCAMAHEPAQLQQGAPHGHRHGTPRNSVSSQESKALMAFCVVIIVQRNMIWRAHEDCMPPGYDLNDTWEIQYEACLEVLHLARTRHEQRLRTLAQNLKESCGAGHPHTIASMACLADFLQLEDRVDEAETLRRAILRQMGEESAEPWPEDRAHARRRLAELLHSRGQNEEAEPLLSAALMECENQLGGSHPETFACYSSYANCFKSQGRLAEAERFYRLAYQSCCILHSAGSPEMSQSMRYLAGILLVEGQVDEAEELFRQLVEQREFDLQPRLHICYSDRYDWLDQLPNELHRQHLSLPEWAESLGQVGRAEELYGSVIGALRRDLGPEHPETLRCTSDLAWHLRSQGHPALALQLYSDLARAQEVFLGPKAPSRALTIRHVAALLHSCGNLAEAEKQYRCALKLSQAAFGSWHANTRRCTKGLVHVLEEQYRLLEAEVVCRTLCKRFGDEELTTGDPEALASVCTLAGLLQHQGKLKEAEPLYRTIMGVLRTETGPDQPQALEATKNLAVVLRAQGLFKEAESLYQHLFHVRSRELGPGHPDALAAAADLAGLMRTLGRFPEAADLLRRVHLWQKALLGPQSLEALRTQQALAEVLGLQGCPAEGEPLCRQTVEGLGRALGADHPDALRAARSLADLLQEHGRLEEAEEHYLRAISGLERQLGTEHQDTATAICSLGLLYRKQGRLEDAEPLYRQQLQQHREKFGSDHPEYIKAASSFAALLQMMGKLDEAEGLFHHVLNVLQMSAGAEDENTVRSMNNLAGLLQAKGRLAQAEYLYSLVVLRREAQLGLEHLDTLKSMNSLAATLQAQGKLEEAEELFRRVFTAMDLRWGDRCRSACRTDPDTMPRTKHPVTPESEEFVKSMTALASILQSRGDLASAEGFYLRAFQTRVSVQGMQHPETKRAAARLAKVVELRGAEAGLDHLDSLASVHHLAAFFKAQGQLGAAETLYHQCCRGYSKAHGMEHPETLRSCGDLAGLFCMQGKFKKAERMHRQVLAAQERSMGRKHSDTLQSIDALAGVLRLKGQTREAEKLFRQVLHDREDDLGADHPSVLRSKNTLAGVLRAQDKFDEAEKLCLYVTPRHDRCGDSPDSQQPEEEPWVSPDSQHGSIGMAPPQPLAPLAPLALEV